MKKIYWEEKINENGVAYLFYIDSVLHATVSTLNAFPDSVKITANKKDVFYFGSIIFDGTIEMAKDKVLLDAIASYSNTLKRLHKEYNGDKSV